MPSKFKLVYAAILALVVGHDIKTRLKAAKLARMTLIAIEEYEDKQVSQQEVINYLIEKLDENQIPADEFDLIAIKYYTD